MLTIDADTARNALAFERLVPALRGAFTRGCEVPPRHHHDAVGNADDSTLLLMPAWSGAYLGIKLVSIFPGNSHQRKPALHASYLLCNADSGEHLALIDGDQITARRTAAASALGASYLARPGSRHLLVLGAGRIGSLLPAAYRSVLPIERVTIWNPTRANAEWLAAELEAQGFETDVADDLETAVRAADCVSCATLSTEPLIQRAWLTPGTHLDLIGSFSRRMREAHDDVFTDTRVFVDAPTAVHETGDLVDPIANGYLREADIQADLATLCRGEHGGRDSDTDITVFKAVGTALEDLASAVLVYENRGE